MGLPWIKVATKLPRDEKSLQLRVELQTKWAWAHVELLWFACAENKPDGIFIGRGCESIIEEWAQWDGRKGEFVSACVRCGFLDEMSNGYRIHAWEKWAGAHVELKKRDRLRKAEARHTEHPLDVPPEVRRKSSGHGKGKARGQAAEKGHESDGTPLGIASKDSRDFETRDSFVERSENHGRSSTGSSDEHNVSALASNRSSDPPRPEAEEQDSDSLVAVSDDGGAVVYVPRRTLNA